MLMDGLNSPSSNTSKLNEAICAQLCDAGLDALERATRFCSKKSPEAIRTLLPEESSPTVLTTAENITKRLAAEKACSWLSANITALVRREWKSRYERVMKAVSGPAAPDHSDTDRMVLDLITHGQATTPKRIQTSNRDRTLSCPPHCDHNASRPSDVLIEIKELLSIAVGPRSDEELPTPSQLMALLHRVGGALACRKFLTPMSEQMLLNSTVLLASKLVCAELPVLPLTECRTQDTPTVGGASGCDSVLLEQFAELWVRPSCCPAPLHLLFTPLTISAVLKSGNPERRNYVVLVRKLVDKGILSEDEVTSHWTKLTDAALPVELMESFQLQPQTHTSSPAPSGGQHPFDALQVSHQTVDGAT